jgi:hypothetical protein
VGWNVRFRPIADTNGTQHDAGVRATYIILAVCCQLGSLALLGTLQLIWAGSDISYYLQLIVGALLLGFVFRTASKASQPLLIFTIIGSATVLAFMPADLAFSSSGPFADAGAPLNEGDVIGGSAATDDYLLSLATLWLAHAVLVLALAFSSRRAAR